MRFAWDVWYQAPTASPTFAGAKLGVVEINASQIVGRELILAIPKGPLTAAQAQAIKDAIQYGIEQGVKVTIKVVE